MALRFLSQEDEMFDQCLCDTSTALLERFQLLGTLSDINDAISKLETAVFRTPDQHPAKAERLSSLCIILARRFQHTEDITDINSSIMNQQRAVELTPEGHKDLPAWLNNLGTSLCNRFKITGSKQDIENAIAYQQKALDIGPVGSPDVPAWLTNLGSSFSHRFELSGDLKDISNAILNEQRSVHLTPEGHPFLPGRINNLAISYARRFKSTGDMLDLSNAISNQQKVIEITPENDLHKSGWLNNLGTMYQRRFKATKDPIDISNAISSQLKAIEVTPEAHSHLPTILNNLGSSYLARFRLEGNLVDISNAVSTHEKAVRLTPSNHPELPSRLNGLGSAYSRRFERTADINDLSNCVSCHERAVELTPQGHVYRSAWSENLGKAYLRRFKHSKDRSDMTLAIAQYRMSATNKFGVPSMRLASAETWARLSRPIDPQQSFEAYAVAVELISQVAGLDQTVQKRHTNLINISYLTTEAAACAFSMSKYHTALEWLEQGRCLVWNQLNQLRTPLDDLFAYDGALARRLLAVSKELEILGSREGGFSSTAEAGNPMENNIKLEAQTQEHISLAQEWDGLLADIRDISQFKDFLRPRRSQDLLENLPDIGFVVVVNVHQNRCDALILHSGSDPVHVSLQKFSYKQAESLRSQLYLCLKDNNVRMREVVDRGVRPYFPAVEAHSIRTVLRELWDCVVLPILASLAQRVSIYGLQIMRG
jgi:tetratricopeptide (TPR) repeat protein